MSGEHFRPLAVDLFCGLGGFSSGFLAEGYRCVGYDIEAHDYGTGGYPGELILRDIRSIHGSELKDAACIVASPPCQAYSYRAMPWKKAKALPPPDNTLFNECWRIQREAIEAAGHYIQERWRRMESERDAQILQSHGSGRLPQSLHELLRAREDGQAGAFVPERGGGGDGREGRRRLVGQGMPQDWHGTIWQQVQRTQGGIGYDCEDSTPVIALPSEGVQAMPLSPGECELESA
jgi:site-specific DNA-cytosine methylase